MTTTTGGHNTGGHKPPHHLSGVPKEARPFQGKPAGAVSRAMAAVVDLLAVMAMVGGLFVGINGAVLAVKPLSFEPVVVPLPITLIIGVVISILYLTMSWVWTGKTLGGTVLGLRVVSTGSTVRLRVVRALVRAVACTLFPIGLAWALVSPQRRSLHDRMVGSAVVYQWSSP